MSDRGSTVSKTSVSSLSNSKTVCPVCGDEFTLKYLFNHIITKHEQGVDLSVEKESVREMITKQLPLCIKYDGQSIRGCLGCNKTYSSDASAKLHFNRDATCFKKHQAALKRFSEGDTTNENDVWHRLIAYYLPFMDHFLTSLVYSGHCNKIVTRAIEELKNTQDVLIENHPDTKWVKVINKAVFWVDYAERSLPWLSLYKWMEGTKWKINTPTSVYDRGLPKEAVVKTGTLKCVIALEKYNATEKHKSEIDEQITIDFLTNVVGKVSSK